MIDDASFFLQNTLSPDQIDAAPTPAETVAAIDSTARDLVGRGRRASTAPPPFRLVASQAF